MDNKHVSTSKKAKKIDLPSTNYNANRIVFRVFTLITCLKLLLIPTYHSTDFEVHRNWLAITHSLPVKEWYTNAKSQWTLDYPPMFAWFEYILSCIAQFIDPEMLKVENLNYASSNTIYFQRSTVIFLDFIFAYGVKEIGKVFCSSFDSYAIFVILSLCNMGLLVVDHIHFQYNGFLLGIFLLAVANVSKINDQVLSRLFPFKRGLVHAYWAANAWALYIGADKLLSLVLKQLGLLTTTKLAVMTGGLVQEQSFLVLPTPTPFVTFLLTLSSILPTLYCLFFKKDYSTNLKQFVRSLILCALCSFIFGWHVHEKAILTAIIPLCVLAVTDKDDARIFLILSSAGHTALLPLLYPTNLTPLKILLLLTYMLASFLTLSRKFKQQLLYFHEYIYVIILPILTVYETVLHKLIFGDKLPFLPLAITSIYCATGVLYSWILYYYMFLRYNAVDQRKKKE
ncbi:ALG6/ALG8 family glucosyltransferase xit isoform X2 [Osmia lignaria lignaria]|uniref:ALG6/ALG8 family glucosyltransferase xit isoform X2 n=1 Tax=Osmia lignaria lignaria TaxID=1437193 RepID=UPI00402B83A0